MDGDGTDGTGTCSTVVLLNEILIWVFTLIVQQLLSCYSIVLLYSTRYRLFSFSGGTFLRGVQGNPNYFPILVQGDAVHGIGSN